MNEQCDSSNRNAHRTLAVFLGISLPLGLAGCGQEGSRSSFSPSDRPYLATNPQTPIGVVDQAPDLQNLLSKQANIQLVYVPVENAQKDQDPSARIVEEGKEATRAAILGSDPAFFKEGLNAFNDATYGRYHPAQVTLVVTPPITLADGCIDNISDSKIRQVNTAVAPVADPEKFRITVVDAPPCGKNDFFKPGIYGFASTRQAPILTNSSFISSQLSPGQKQKPSDIYWRIAVHEGGHHWGLKHAGTADCDDVQRASGCKVNTTNDPHSAMSYVTKDYDNRAQQDRFTIPELFQLNLLREDEIITLDNDNASKLGSVVLHTMEGNGPKVIINKGSTNPVFISWEDDPSAQYDVSCNEGRDVPKGVAQADVHSMGSTTLDGRNIAFVCHKVNKAGRRSLQLRRSVAPDDKIVSGGDISDRNSFVLIGRTPKNLNLAPRILQPQIATKGVTTGGVIYRDDKVIVRLPEYTDTSSIRLQVETVKSS